MYLKTVDSIKASKGNNAGIDELMLYLVPMTDTETCAYEEVVFTPLSTHNIQTLSLSLEYVETARRVRNR